MMPIFKTLIRRGIYSFFFSLMTIVAVGQNSKFTISGYVKEEQSSELLLGVTVYIPSLETGVITNNYGFYSITLEAGHYDIIYSYIGFETIKKSIDINQNVVLDQFLQPSVLKLDEVVISGELHEKESAETQMSLIRLSPKDVEEIPAFMGEKDVLKVLQLKPGIQSGSEGTSGLYVRGGGPDQNLLILDDAIVYNANHLFGFFSVFNGDAIKSISLYKGGFPARFGGRISSVLQMDMKDGNKEEFHGKVGVGLIASSLLLEGPIKKGKTSFLISGRRTYIDALIAPFMTNKSGYYFYDLNVKFNHEFSPKNKIYISGYLGKDKFFFSDKDDFGRRDEKINWGNSTATVRWNHLFSQRLFSNLSSIFSRYQFQLGSEEDDNFGLTYKLTYSSSIRDFSFKYDFDFFPSVNQSIKFGAITTFHQFIPSALVVNETNTTPIDNQDKFNTIESAIYFESDMKVFKRLKANLGFRLSHFVHDKKEYINPEPRIALAYVLPLDLSVKASFSSMNQYVHLLSNSGGGLPTDLWVSSTDRVKPQSANQIALGVVKDLPNNISVSLEGYYKKTKNVISYKNNASFLVVESPSESSEGVSWEDNITFGRATSRGLEFLVHKKIGTFTGWIGYTLSKTELQYDDLNFGEKFLAKYDRRHDISIVGIYKLSDHLTLSGTWIYGSGNHITLPLNTVETFVDQISFGRSRVTFENVSQRNNFTTAPYHRMDISVHMSKRKKRGVRTWELSIYNIYSRNNPFFYFRDSKNILTRTQGISGTQGILKKVSLFPILPAVKYSFKF